MAKKIQKMTKKERMEMIKKEVRNEIYELNREIKIEKQLKGLKKFLILSIIIAIIVAIKVFLGTIEINNILGYPSGKTRFYKLTVNGEVITTDYTIKHTFPIIPYLININSYYMGSSNIKTDNDGTYYYENGWDNYIIDISSYSCYKDGYRVECRDENRDMKATNDTKYTKLIITRTNNPYEEVYNGPFINDITPYVVEKGVYNIEITAEYSFVETKVNFYFVR